MSEREKLEAERNAAETAYDAHRRIVDNEASEAARVARLAVVTKHAAETERLSQVRAATARALREYIDATSTHEWEGRRVKRTTYYKDRRGHPLLDRPPKTVEIGIVQVRRSDSEFAANLAGYSIPKFGEAFVRLFKKDGKLGTKISKLPDWGSKWKLDDSASGIDARSGETEGLDPKGESPVGNAETPKA